MQRILTYVSLLGVYPLLIASSVIVLANVVWGYQALVEAFECFIFYITFIVLHSLECKYDPKPCSDQDYLKIGMKKYKDDITFSGVPLNYNDAVDNEEDRDVKLRQQVLSKIIASVQMHQQNSLFSNERLNSCRLQKTMRRAFSYKHLPVIEEESDESDNEENKQDGFFYYKPKRKRRFSIGTDSDLEKYADETFFKAIDDIRSGKYLPNNVYADSHPEREYTEDDRMFHQERATQTDDNDLKLLWRLARTIPAFKLTDILGEFEVDPNGMYIIVRDGGLLKDKHGRLVNSRGYLVDIEGNVIHHNGTKIFHYDELDEFGEIPAPFALDADEFDMIAKPNLLPKTPYKSKAKPPKPRGKKPNDSFAKSKLGSNISSAKSKRPQSKKSDISDQKSSTMLKGNSNIRSIASNAPRPQTTKKLMKRTMPLSNNFTQMRDAEVTQEPSDFDSVIDLEKVILSHNDKEFGKPNKRMNRSEVDDVQSQGNGGLWDDFMLNARPIYYGDTSDIISRSRKLQY